MELTAAQVRTLLAYDPETGIFTWVRPRKGMKKNAPAGSVKANGYLQVGISRRYYSLHRLAWLITTGKWPIAQIDHKNGNKLDNRWSNLREASRSQNMWNRRKSAANTSGFKGVRWEAKKWRVRLKYHGKLLHIGFFDTVEAAHAAYCEAAKQYYGEFARTI